jgi:hypothetical protein
LLEFSILSELETGNPKQCKRRSVGIELEAGNPKSVGFKALLGCWGEVLLEFSILSELETGNPKAVGFKGNF